MRLIDAEALKKKLERGIGICDVSDYALECLEEIIDDSPTIEAEPVRHGWWHRLSGDEWNCTNCGGIICTEGSWELPTMKYCDECGARMDLKG
jgi:hypothetical protein